MSEPIRPALTAEEWANWGEDIRHGIAALALWEHPCGFTRDDVIQLRRLAEYARIHTNDKGKDVATSIADRIEALLPFGR